MHLFSSLCLLPLFSISLSPYSVFIFICVFPFLIPISSPHCLFSLSCLSIFHLFLDPLTPSTVCHPLFPQCLHPSLSSCSSQEGQVHRLLSENMWRELIGSSIWLFPPDCFCMAVTWLWFASFSFSTSLYLSSLSLHFSFLLIFTPPYVCLFFFFYCALFLPPCFLCVVPPCKIKPPAAAEGLSHCV